MPFNTTLGPTIRKEHILQLIYAWIGQSGYGVPLSLNQVNDATNPALTIRNLSTTGGHLKIYHSDTTTYPSPIFQVTDQGINYTIASGSAGQAGVTPGLQFAASPTTGFWYPAAGTIGLVAGGVDAMRISSSALTLNGIGVLAQSIGADSNGLLLAPGNATAATQAGPRMVLRATSLSGSTVNTRDFIVRPSTTDASGNGKLEILTKLGSGAETVVFSIASDGTVTGAFGGIISSTIGTTKGDLIGFSATSTPSRLGAGSAGQVLTVDSSTATGLKWASVGATAPTSHASTHNAGGGDGMAIDAAAGTGSLRTLGTSSTTAAAGNHGHSDLATTSSLSGYATTGSLSGYSVTSHSHSYSGGLSTGTLTTSQGIQFPGTQNLSANANNLDDYEEGTWSPTFRDTNGNTYNPFGGSATVQEYRYTKIGNMVRFSMIMQSTAGTSFSQNHTATLPFNCTMVTMGTTGSFGQGSYGWISINQGWTMTASGVFGGNANSVLTQGWYFTDQ